MKFFASALSLLLLASSVSAHGFVPKIVVDGKTFAGNVPQGASKKSAIRQVSSISPVKGASNRAINCGPNAKAATGVADAMPGSKVAFHWVASAKPKQNVCSFILSLYALSHSSTVATQHWTDVDLHGVMRLQILFRI